MVPHPGESDRPLGGGSDTQWCFQVRLAAIGLWGNLKGQSATSAVLQARDFQRGRQSMPANPIDDRVFVVAGVGSFLLVHLTKPPLLRVAYVEATLQERSLRLRKSGQRTVSIACEA